MDDALEELVEFRTADGQTGIVVATDLAEAAGAQPISLGERGVRRATESFESSLAGARAAAEAALRVFRDGRLKPDSVEIEFGVKITAETGAVLVKGSAEGHLVVKLTWTPERRGAADSGGSGPDGGAGSGGDGGSDSGSGSDGAGGAHSGPGSDGDRGAQGGAGSRGGPGAGSGPGPEAGDGAV